MYENLFDKITINGKEFKGVIDYVTKKQVMFYDFTNVDSCAITLLVLEWKTQAPEERFSVYQAKNFPLVDIGTVSIFQKKHIELSDGDPYDLEVNNPQIIEKKRIKASPSRQ